MNMDRIDCATDLEMAVPDVFDVISGRIPADAYGSEAWEIVSHCESCGRVTEGGFTIAGRANCMPCTESDARHLAS